MDFLITYKFEEDLIKITLAIDRATFSKFPSVESPWTQWTSSMDIVWLEYCNEGPWILSTQSMDIVLSIH